MARAEIAKFPEGTVAFEDHLDDDGVTEAPVRIRVTLGVRDGRVHVDFAGSSAQVRGGINATLSVAQSAAYFALRCAMTSDVPDNSGYYRLVQVTAPEGSVVNPRFPACCAAKRVTAFRVCDAILGALAEMLPERMTAAGEGGATIVTFGGTDQAGGPFVLMDLVLGGMGGRPDRDGVEGIANPSCNVRNTPIEILEATFPIRVEAYGFVPDTGGAGRFRGALSVCRAYRFLGRDGVLQVRSDRHRYLPYGVAGGCPGTPSRNTRVRGGAESVLPPKFVIPIQPGDVFRHVQAGAGGYGPPSDRDPKQVLEDVRDGKISAEYARRVYGVSP
jgi:N-methylhydantoinase B